MGVTISDVAQRAGVSPATVSKYLNRKKVSAKSYARIEEAIRELNYQVNDFARGLRTNTSQMVGLLVPSIDYTYATSLFKVVQERLTENGYGSVLYNYKNSADAFVEKLALVRQRMVDGVIILISGETNDVFRQGLQELQAAKIPFVLVNGRVKGIEADTVLADNAQAIYTCIAHLLENGHRKIGLVMAQRNSYNARERAAGYHKAYAEWGLEAEEELIFCFESRKAWLIEAKEKLVGFLQAHPELTALVMPSFRMTIVAMQAIHHMGRKIGKDIALIGFDCDIVNGAFDPELTYIQLPAEEIAAIAIELLIDAIGRKEERAPREICIPVYKVDGDSVFSI